MIAGERVVKVGEQLRELLGEVVGRDLATVTLQRDRRQLIGARRTTEAEIDPVRIQGGEDRERLGHLQRAVVGQHDAAAADPDRARGRRDRADQGLGAVPESIGLPWCSATQ